MNDSIGSRLMHAWNAFRSPKDPIANIYSRDIFTETSVGSRPDRAYYGPAAGRDLVGAVKNRLALDVATLTFQHIREDEDENFISVINSQLNDRLTISPNVDQEAQTFWHDVCLTLFDEGHVVIAPIDTTVSPRDTGSFDILSMRVGRVTSWHPQKVMVNCYNEQTGMREDTLFDKKSVAIITNPFYLTMNEPNSVLRRLQAKLALLDKADNEGASGKLDVIIQLPFSLRSDHRKLEAEVRRKDLEEQMRGSQLGIGYIDATEKITQLNRPATNNLIEQVNNLTEQVYAQFGFTKEVFEGTASPDTMNNYFNQSIYPIARAIVQSMHAKFLTKTARTQGQAIRYSKDPFRFLEPAQLATTLDKYIEKRVLTPNEARGILGRRRHVDETADQLQNPNIDVKEDQTAPEDQIKDDAEPPIELHIPEEDA